MMEFNATSNASRIFYAPESEERQPIVYWFLGTFSVFLIGFIFAKRKDTQAEKSVRCIVLPMRSFFQRSTWYQLLLYTMDATGSGTTANVFMRIYCSEGPSAVFRLTDVINPDRKFLEAGSVACFLISLPTYLGAPTGIHIWHDNTGQYPCWLLEAVSIKTIESDKVLHFHVSQWLSIIRPNSRLFIHQRSSSEAENESHKPILGKYRKTWLSILKLCIYNSHLWLSFFTSNDLSTFSKLQRLVCMLLSFLSMSATLVFLDDKPISDSSDALSLCNNGLCVTTVLLYKSLAASTIAFLPTTLLCILFEGTSHYESSKQNADAMPMPTPTTGMGPSVKFGLRTKSRRYRNLQKSSHKSNHLALKCGTESSRNLKANRHYDAVEVNNTNAKLNDHFLPQDPCNGLFKKDVGNGVKIPERCFKKRKQYKSERGIGKNKLSTIQEGVIHEFGDDVKTSPIMPSYLSKLQASSSYLPKQCLHIEWIFSIISCSALAYFIWLQSLAWHRGNFKTWLVSTFFALAFDIAFLQFLRPLFQCLWISRSYSKTNINILTVLRFHLNFWSEVEKLWVAVHSADKQLPYIQSLNRITIEMPIHLEQEKQRLRAALSMKTALKSMPLWIIIFLAAMVIVLGVREQSSYRMKENCERLIFMPSPQKWSILIDDWPKFMKWCEDSFLPAVYISETVSADISERQGTIYQPQQWQLPQRVRITQRRTKKGGCNVASEMKPFVDYCSGVFSDENEDRGNYNVGWKRLQLPRLIANVSKSPWKYQASDEAGNSFATRIKLNKGPSGGYVAVLGPDYKTAIQKILLLRNRNWIDEYTRKLIIDLGLYNLEMNVATMIQITADLASTGDLKISYKLKVVAFQRTFNADAWILFACFAVLMLFASGLLIQSLWEIFRRKCKSLFSLATRFLIIIFTAASTTLFIVREMLLGKQKDISKSAELHIIIHQISSYDDYISFTVSIMCLAITAYITSAISSVNCMQSIARTFKSAANTTFCIAFILFIMLAAFSSLSFLTFCSRYHDFSDIIKAVTTLVSLAAFKDKTTQDTYSQLPKSLLFITSASLIALHFIYALSLAVIQNSYGRHISKQKLLLKEYLMIKNRIDCLYNSSYKKSSNSCNNLDPFQWTSESNKLHRSKQHCKAINETLLGCDRGRIKALHTGQLQSLIVSLNELFVDNFSWDLCLLEAVCRLTHKRQLNCPTRMVTVLNDSAEPRASGAKEQLEITKNRRKEKHLNPVKQRPGKSLRSRLPSLNRNDNHTLLEGPHRSMSHALIPHFKLPNVHSPLSKFHTLIPNARKTKIERISIQKSEQPTDGTMLRPSHHVRTLQHEAKKADDLLDDANFLQYGHQICMINDNQYSHLSPETDCRLPSAVENTAPFAVCRTGPSCVVDPTTE